MNISVLTLFPEVFNPLLKSSILGKAVKNDKIRVKTINIRDFSTDKHRSVDDRPYGGGKGMILRVDIVEKAIHSIKLRYSHDKSLKTILLDPKGKIYNQKKALSLSKLKNLILVCGHYEGIDFRINKFVDESISIGEYILSGGEIAAMVMIDSICRLLPNVLKDKKCIEYESFSKKYYHEYPQYTRPLIYKGYRVPKILTEGNHAFIDAWRNNKAKKLVK